MQFISPLSALSHIAEGESRSISAENFTGERGCGGMAEHGTGENCARDLGRGWKISPSITLKAHSKFTLADIEGEGTIRHIWCAGSFTGRFTILRVYWDDCPVPSIECPLGDFFCAPTANEQYFPLVSAAVCVNPRNGLNTYLEMPFRKRARFEIENISDKDCAFYYQIDYRLHKVEEDAGYLHTQFYRSNPLTYMTDHTLLDIKGARGQYVGTYMYWGVNNDGWWGEGEIKFFLDGDREFPTICGTGTEDYFCGAWNFDNGSGYERFCTPYSGMIPNQTDNVYKANKRFSLYRWHITDPISFADECRVTIQALGWRT
ncbi:MAG: DUF2961 domain-containing protein, partial [Clostridiales bacterium]|nr:DUF2961 domain-containing protein [Clostridiales bacterium]